MPQNDIPLIAAGETVGLRCPEEFMIQISLIIPQSSLQSTLLHDSEIPIEAGRVMMNGPGEKAEEMALVAKRVMKILIED